MKLMTMFGLPADVVAAARVSVLASLTDTATVYSRARTADGFGDFTVAETSRGTFACRVASPSVSEQRTSRVDVTVSHVVRFPAGTTIATTDRIAVGGRSLEVVGVLQGTTALLLTAQCVEVL